MIEKEYKFLVSYQDFKNIFNKITVIFKNTNYKRKSILQVNYYYDTSDLFLYKNNITYRIRQKDNNLQKQIKIKEFGNKYQKAVEHSENIKSIKKNYMFSMNFNNQKKDLSTELIGNLITKRESFFINDIRIDFDKNLYLGKCDYEIEIEFQNDIENEILSLFDNFNTNNEGKYKRFINTYLSLGE